MTTLFYVMLIIPPRKRLQCNGCQERARSARFGRYQAAAVTKAENAYQ